MRNILNLFYGKSRNFQRQKGGVLGAEIAPSRDVPPLCVWMVLILLHDDVLCVACCMRTYERDDNISRGLPREMTRT